MRLSWSKSADADALRAELAAARRELAACRAHLARVRRLVAGEHGDLDGRSVVAGLITLSVALAPLDVKWSAWASKTAGFLLGAVDNDEGGVGHADHAG